MKAITILIAATSGLLIAQPMQAKEGALGHEAGADRLEILKESLDLTPEQTEKIRPILQKQREQLQTLREDTSMSKEQKLGKVREMVKSTADEIRPLLTPEQREKWAQIAESFREAVQGRAGAHEGALKEPR